MTKPEIIEIKCPFCGYEKIKANFYPSVLQTAVSRSAAKGSVTKFYRTKEKYEVLSDCEKCGKKAKEIEKALKEGIKDPEKEKKIEDRLKQQGLFIPEIKTKLK
ncbi:MAG: hypothetical protein KQA31_00655 [Candidatus Aenigmarchaeota archaeon]|nr:hypothetical protein [Candidatus Aenigmarchaeota archaeon]